MSARKSSRLARMRDNLRDTIETPKKADSSVEKTPKLEKKKTITGKVPEPRKTRSSAALSHQRAEVKNLSICDVKNNEVQLQYRSSMYDKIKGGKRVIKPNPGNLSYAKPASKKTIPKKEEEARNFSLRSKTDACKQKNKVFFKAPEQKGSVSINKSKRKVEEIGGNEDSKKANMSKVKKEKKVKNEHENSEEVLILVDEEDGDVNSSEPVHLSRGAEIEREQKKEDVEVDVDGTKETVKGLQPENGEQNSKGFSATTTTSQKKNLKRKSSIPDFFKPRSREQIVTPAKKARKDAGRESSASDSSRPESECPPVEPPFVKGLEAPTIVVDDSNGPITIDETCAEKRRVLHKVKSLKKSRDGAAERRRERLKNTNYWSKEAQIIKGKERPGWSKANEEAKSTFSSETPKRSFSPRNDTSFTPVQRETSQRLPGESASSFLSPLSVPIPGPSIMSSPLATPIAPSPAKSTAQSPVNVLETRAKLPTQMESQAVHQVICQPESISISSDDGTDMPVFVPAPVEQPEEDDSSSNLEESDGEPSEIEPENDYERGMIAIREKHSIVIVSDDEEDHTLPLYNLDFKERRDALSFACFADWLTTSPLVKIAVENWQKNSPEDCRRLGDKIFVNSYQPKDLPWRNCKKKERMDAAQLVSKQVDHVTGNEIQMVDEIELAQINHKEKACENATRSSGFFDNDTGEEIANMQFPKKIWHIVNDPNFHCMFWLGIHCDPNPKAEEYPQKQMRCSTSFIINKRWAKQPGQVLDNTKQANILFNTQNYQSLVRQLNLYGFRKVKRNTGDSIYKNYKQALKQTKDPKTGKSSSEQDIDEFRHTFFRECQPYKLQNIKRQKPFKPTNKNQQPPRFMRAKNLNNIPVAKRENPRRTGVRNNDSDKSDEYSEDEYELPEDRIANKDGVVVFNTPVYDADDPENAFGPRL